VPALAGNFLVRGEAAWRESLFQNDLFLKYQQAVWQAVAFRGCFVSVESRQQSRAGGQDNAIKTTLFCSGVPVVLAGDYNVVPTLQDIYPTRSLDNNALIQPESRQAFARLLAQGWTDAMRKLHPDGPLWTFWDYKFEPWQKDKCTRLDHFLLSRNLSDRLVDGCVDRWARGQENASDNAPTWIMLGF
jgi:hypothetical protein